MVAGLDGDWQMLLMIVVDDYHSLVLYIFPLCHVYLLLSRSCNDLFCFPTMHGTDDVMFLLCHV